MSDENDKALGDAIRRRRAATGLTAKDVADRIGMNQAVYGRIELGGRAARATELGDIAKVLGVTADELLHAASPTALGRMNSLLQLSDTMYVLARDIQKEHRAFVKAVAEEVGDNREMLEYQHSTVKGKLNHAAVIFDTIAKS